MMLYLMDLPPEVVLDILHHLRAIDIERVARTFNKSLYSLCLPFLQPLLARKHNARLMRARFANHDDPFGYAFERNSVIETIADSICPKYDLDPNDGPFTLSPGGLSYEFMDLHGDFSWLAPLDPVLHEVMEVYHRGPAASEEAIVAIEAQAKKLGLKLPDSFLYFLWAGPRLQRRNPSTSACYYELGPGGLKKCPAHVDGGAGGYAVRIYSDQQCCAYWTLYLDPGPEGYHCVLVGSDDANEDGFLQVYKEMCLEQGWLTQKDLDAATEASVGVAVLKPGGSWLCATDFEEFVANMYIEGYMSFVHRGRHDVTPPEVVVNFVKENYRRNGVPKEATITITA